MKLADLPTPALVLDRATLADNCAAMAARAAKLGVRLRPHMKTAKSAEAAKIATAGQFGGITVSTLAEAEYFAAHPVLPANAWAANINIDSLNMAGPARDIVLLGAERSTLGQMANELAAERGRVIGPDPQPGNGYFFRSDHFPLAKIGIPALSYSEPVEYTGDAVTIAFNPGYLLDGLGAVRTQKVHLSFTTPSRPALLKPVDEDGNVAPGYLYLLMPVRLPG